MNVADAVKALTELKHTPASPNSIRRMSTSSQSVYQATNQPQLQQQQQQQQTPVLSSFHSQGQKLSYVSQSGGIIYAQPSQIMSGSSPNAVRRISSFRSQSAERKSSEGEKNLVKIVFK